MPSKLTKTIKINLALALVFTAITFFIFSFTLAFIINSLVLVYNASMNQTVVIYDNFLYFVSFLSLILTVCVAAGIIPFAFLLHNKYQWRTWYVKTLLVFAVVTISISLLLAFSLPALYTWPQNLATIVDVLTRVKI